MAGKSDAAVDGDAVAASDLPPSKPEEGDEGEKVVLQHEDLEDDPSVPVGTGCDDDKGYTFKSGNK